MDIQKDIPHSHRLLHSSLLRLLWFRTARRGIRQLNAIILISVLVLIFFLLLVTVLPLTALFLFLTLFLSRRLSRILHRHTSRYSGDINCRL